MIRDLYYRVGAVERDGNESTVQRSLVNNSTQVRTTGLYWNRFTSSTAPPPQNQDRKGEGDDERKEVPQEQASRRRWRGNEGAVLLDMEAIMARFDQMGNFMRTEFQGIRGEQHHLQNEFQEIQGEHQQLRHDMNQGFANLQGLIDDWRKQYSFPPPPPDM